MEARHANNIHRKATRALELLEAIVIPRVYPNETLTDALELAHDAMFTEGSEMGAHLWEALGIAYALHNGRTESATFDTSRPAIASLLRSRIRETDTDQTDPFDIFASNLSGQN